MIHKSLIFHAAISIFDIYNLQWFLLQKYSKLFPLSNLIDKKREQRKRRRNGKCVFKKKKNSESRL